MYKICFVECVMSSAVKCLGAHLNNASLEGPADRNCYVQEHLCIFSRLVDEVTIVVITNEALGMSVRVSVLI